MHEEVLNIIRYYLNLGIDGFRVDLACSIVKDDECGKASCEVWRKIFGEAKKEFPNALFVSEWGQPHYSVGSGSFDIDYLTHCFSDGYNLLFRKESGTNVIKSDGNSFFRKEGKGECKSFFDYFLSCLKEVEGKGYISVVTGNHDLPRISMGRTEDELKAVFAFILALPTVPMIYYGDEIGMPYTKLKTKDGGYCRTGSRTPMQWTSGKNAGFSDTDGELYLPIDDNYKTVNCDDMEKRENSLINTVKDLVSVKREYLGEFSENSSFELLNEDYPLIFTRKNNGKVFYCAINPSDREYAVDLQENSMVLLSNNVTVSEKEATLKGVSFIWAIAD